MVAVALLGTSQHASADDHCLSLVAGISGGIEVAPLAADDAFGRGQVAVDLQWRDRWVIGVALGLAVDATATQDLPGADIRSYLVEAALRVQPSPRIGLVLGWRVGRAGLDFGYAYIHALDIEPMAVVIVPLVRSAELHVEPLVVDFYDASTWQATIGVQVGVAWRWQL